MTNRIRTSPLRPRLTSDAEPTLSELLEDPILRAVMVRDGIDCTDLVGAIDIARARLGLGPWSDAPCEATAASSAACCG